MSDRKCDLCGVRLDQQYVQYNRMLYCIPCHLAGNRNAQLDALKVACLGIVDPETTVPKLVDVIRTLVEGDHDEGCEFWGGPDCACTCIPARARVLLARTGQKP